MSKMRGMKNIQTLKNVLPLGERRDLFQWKDENRNRWKQINLKIRETKGFKYYKDTKILLE